MLVISGQLETPPHHVHYGFNLAIEMLVISGWANQSFELPAYVVSISQSRCLSFQVLPKPALASAAFTSFNLAIEMLVISGTCSGRLLAC